MVRRIALLAALSSVLTGFAPPNLPEDSRAIYRFERSGDRAGSTVAVYQAPVKTLDGGVFSLAVGFSRAFDGEAKRHVPRRERAQELVDKLAAALATSEPSGVDISIARLYVDTREILINVVVSDASRLEQVRRELEAELRSMPGVVFVGAPGKVYIE